MIYRVTNTRKNSEGVRAIRDGNVLVRFIRPRETRSLELDEAQAERCRKLGMIVEVVSSSEEVSGGSPAKTGIDQAQSSSGDTETSREDKIMAIIRELAPEDFTEAGAPKVTAINERLDDDDEAVDADERDAIWAEMQPKE